MTQGRRLKLLRLKHNYSQEYLAFELKISQKTYSNLEHDKTKLTLDMLLKLALVFCIEKKTLLDMLTDETLDNPEREREREREKKVSLKKLIHKFKL